VIVLAAAGNCVRLVVFPARYDECIAVGGSNAADQPWKGSCRGPAVDISAPAQNVLKASVANGSAVSQGQGTSFAVALTAGVAALWLAHHGRADLVAAARARGETLQVMFRRLVRATARRPAGWEPLQYGAGIVDAKALLAADLDAGLDRAAAPPPDPVAEPAAAVADLVAEAVGPEAVENPGLDWRRYGPELSHALLDAQLHATEAGAGADGIDREAPTPPVSADLAAAISNPRLRDRLGLDDGPGADDGLGAEAGEESGP